MSAVSRIDYSGVLALEAVLEQLKPGSRKRVAVGGETVAVDGEIHTRKKGDVFVQNVWGIRLHLAHMTSPAHRALLAAGLLDGDVSLGLWTIVPHSSIATAIESVREDSGLVTTM